MSLHRDLLEQARHLARKEPRRPRQASLRRAVSAGYYALSHLLVDQSTRRMVGGGRDREALRHSLARAFAHTDMKQVCAGFASGQPPSAVRVALAGAPVPLSLQQVAQAFIDLQQARHDADYNLSKRFTRTEVDDLVDIVDAAFAAWGACRGTAAADVFLVALLAGKRLRPN